MPVRLMMPFFYYARISQFSILHVYQEFGLNNRLVVVVVVVVGFRNMYLKLT